MITLMMLILMLMKVQQPRPADHPKKKGSENENSPPSPLTSSACSEAPRVGGTSSMLGLGTAADVAATR